MTNKEKMKKIISSDFSKENNYEEMIKKIEGEGMKNKNKIWKLSLVSLCFIAMISGILWNFGNEKETILWEPATSYSKGQENRELYINYLGQLGATKLDADAKIMGTNEANMVWPERLLGMEIPKDLAQMESYMLYTRKDQNSSYDILNSYVYHYSNEDNSKNLRIAFSKTNKPLRDYHFSEEGSKETTLGDVSLRIFNYEDIYFTEFTDQGYYFDIETTGISEEELVDFLTSIF